jgi:hypothetical protein
LENAGFDGPPLNDKLVEGGVTVVVVVAAVWIVYSVEPEEVRQGGVVIVMMIIVMVAVVHVVVVNTLGVGEAAEDWPHRRYSVRVASQSLSQALISTITVHSFSSRRKSVSVVLVAHETFAGD